MKVFLTSATGYIGGTVAVRLGEAGHQVVGLVRDPAKAAALAASGVEPVVGSIHYRGPGLQQSRPHHTSPRHSRLEAPPRLGHRVDRRGLDLVTRRGVCQ